MIDVKLIRKPRTTSASAPGIVRGSSGNTAAALPEGMADTVASLLDFRAALTGLLAPCDTTGAELPWAQATQSDGDGGIMAKALKAKVTFFSMGNIAAYGRGSGTGGSGGSGGSSVDMSAYLTKDDAVALYQPKGSYAAAAHSHSFNSLTGKPTTLAGYGITDALPAKGTAAAATKLATARTIWGKEFDGTANISGHMTAVGNIGTADVPAGQIYSNGSFRSMGNSGWSSETHGGGWHMTDSTWIRAWMKPVRIENFTGIGPNGFAVGLKIQSGAYNAGMELTTATTTLGLGAHENGSVYFWHSKTQPDVPDDKQYIMWFDGISWYSNFGMRVARLYLDTDRKVYVEYDAERDVIVCNRTLVSTGNVAAYSSAT